MGTVRLRLTFLVCAAMLAAAALPGAAAASGSGGAAAPKAPGAAAPSGGAEAGARPAGPRKAGQRRATRGKRSAGEQRARKARRRAAARRRRARRKAATEPAPAEPVVPAAEAGHRFPLAGVYDLGGEGARFGAKRSGHSHQGHDILAAEGTPVVAPWAGTVEYVRFQRSGAGWYVVLDGDGEDRDYVFMHLRAGSILVAAGQRVGAGQPFAQVGNTGSSTAPHLHFEVWAGGWYAGGHPIDPLPLLSMWAGLA